MSRLHIGVVCTVSSMIQEEVKKQKLDVLLKHFGPIQKEMVHDQ